MVYIEPDLWNTLFSWMSPKKCMLPEGCTLPLEGVIVYVFLVIFIITVLYWSREDIKNATLQIRERIPNPLG